MKNNKLLLKLLQQSTNQGITLTELLVALVISGIVLTATTSGFINILRANRDVESKSTQLSGLTRGLTFLQEDIKQGISVNVSESSDSQCTDVDSNCLIIELSGGNEIYYGFKDISIDPSVFLKPGILKRKDLSSGIGWEEVADGLAIDVPDPTCDQGTITWGDETTPTLYGNTGDGFRFCIDETENRLARIFLYGHIIDNDTPINVDVVTFARSSPSAP